jgi:hypothetical protein
MKKRFIPVEMHDQRKMTELIMPGKYIERTVNRRQDRLGYLRSRHAMLSLGRKREKI